MSKQNGRDRGPDFPCATLDGALIHLRRPPTAAAVRFKIQNTAQDAAQVAAYIDARLVFDRLDHVCGGRWSAAFEALPEKLIPAPVDRDGQVLSRPPIFVRCRLVCFGVTRQDVGEGQDPKAAFSDAIKRAAVHFGIGRALYGMRLPWLREGDGEGELRRNRKGQLMLDRRTERYCREQYGLWLDKRGVRQFGEPLDHGDEADAPGFEADRRQAPAGDTVAASEPTPEDRAAAAAPAAAPDNPTASEHEAAGGPARREIATPVGLERKQVEHWAATGRYKAETVAALATLLCGERDLEKLDREATRKLATALEFAVRGKVTDRELGGKVAELAKHEQREQAAIELNEWLVGRANEAELTPAPRRRAA